MVRGVLFDDKTVPEQKDSKTYVYAESFFTC
jgi:hypothetical protein